MILEVIAYGSAPMLDTVLNGVAMLTNGSGGYSVSSIAKIGMLASLLMVGFGAVFSQKLEVQKLLAGIMFFYMMFLPTTHVSIYDPYTGSSRLVANVPIGVGAPMAIITQTGRWMTEAFELAYWEPESKFERGYLNSLQVLLKARDARAPIDIPLERSIQSYIETCVFYSMQDEYDPNRITEEKLLTAIDLWAAMETHYINRDAQTYLIDVVNGHQATCVNAYGLITSRLNDASFRSEWDKYLKTLIGSNDETPSTSALDQVDAALNMLDSVSGDAQTYMLNAFIGNMYKCESAQECSMLTQAQEQRRMQWGMEHSNFQQVARPIMAFTESLIPALAPIMALLATLSPIGVSMIVKYFLTLMWISMWQPLMALVNMYIAHAASNDMQRFSSAGLDLQSYSGITNSWTTLADWISVGGMLAASVPVIAGTVVMGASMASGKLASFAQGTAGSGEAASSAAPSISKVSPIHSHGSMQASNPGVTRDAKGTALAGANPSGAGTVADMASNVASATSTRQDALKAATTQTENARSAFMDTASNTIASESSKMRSNTDGAAWGKSNSTLKSTADRLAKQFGWNAQQSHEMAIAAQMASGLVSNGKLGKGDAEDLLSKVASKKGLRASTDGRLSGKAGASGSASEGLSSLLDSAITDSSSTSATRSGSVTDTDTVGTRNVAARIAQSQQAKDYSEAKSRQQEATQQYQEAAVWSAGVSQQSNYDMPTLAGIMGRTPAVAKDIQSLANSSVTGKQLAAAENGLRAAGIYGHNGSRNNIDPNLVRAKALADNGHGAALLNVLRDHGIVRPNEGPTDLQAKSNSHLANQNPGLSAERAGEVSDIAQQGGQKALLANQSRGAPLPEGQAPAPAGNPSASGQGGPGGSGGRTTNTPAPGAPAGKPAGTGGRESIDGAFERFNSQHVAADREKNKADAARERGDVMGFKPTEEVKNAGEQVTRSANLGAVGEAAKRAASIVRADIAKLSAGEQLQVAAGAAAAVVGPGLVGALTTAMSTKEGRQALGKAIGRIAGKRAASMATTGAVAATGVGAPIAAAMVIGNIALTAKDVNDVYKVMQQQGALPPKS